MSDDHYAPPMEIVKHTLIVLKDNIPRPAAAIVAILRQRGLSVDKSAVNRALFHYGSPQIIYDSSTYTYTLNQDAASPMPEPLSADLSISSQSANPATAQTDLLVGMLVRVPIDQTDALTLAECRDYRIGRVKVVNLNTVVVALNLTEHDPFQRQSLTLPHQLVRRCAVITPSAFSHMRLNIDGQLLVRCEDTFTAGQYTSYYAQIDGVVQRVSEAEIQIAAHAQAPDPAEQLGSYEIHPHIWKHKRDHLLQSVIELKTATYGLEELVGSRILLLPHQAETIARVLADRQVRWILADEVGLGKTIEACVILKGLQRRQAGLRALIIAPRTLLRQWHNELHNKFWQDFEIVSEDDRFGFDPQAAGIILAVEDLSRYPKLAHSLIKRHWDLVIFDEAHRLHRNSSQYAAAHMLSSAIQHCLVLSATPVQRRSHEYLALLRLMNPKQYDAMPEAGFRSMLDVQGDLRKRLAYVGRGLTNELFDPGEFHDEIRPLVTQLAHDKILPFLVASVEPQSRDRGLRAAQDVHSYLSENYRIENRVARNRRASLSGLVTIPTRSLDEQYSYQPSQPEYELLAELQEYMRAGLSHDRRFTEMMRCLAYSSASSPNALHGLLAYRQRIIAGSVERVMFAKSVQECFTELPAFDNEAHLLERLMRFAEKWVQVTTAAIDAIKPGTTPPAESPHRLLQVLRAIKSTMSQKQKVLIFCRWEETYTLLHTLLAKWFSARQFAVFTTTRTPEYLQNEIDRFQVADDCLVMLSSEAGGEGRNFQIADAIIHVDIPWMPAQIEQRIGRVDRLGRDGVVTSIVPYAHHTLEADLFRLWQGGFEIFTRSMSGMEIVLENVQDQVEQAFAENPGQGLAELLPLMKVQAADLRAIIEEERYAEDSSSQRDRRVHLGSVLERYRDGRLIEKALMTWANLAGLTSSTEYDPHSRTNLVVFEPLKFNPQSIKNAKFVDPPDMTEALRRSKRQSMQRIRGTFDRKVAVQREELVFFAPGERWTDTIIANALYADRGQCSAVMRSAPQLETDWHGIECLYSIRVDPRPLFGAGGDPVLLYYAQGYLDAPAFRVLVGLDGQIVRASSAIAQCILADNDNGDPRQQGDIHLGKRSGNRPPLAHLMATFPPQEWQSVISETIAIAQAHVESEYAFMRDLAQEAAQVLERRITGMRAAHRWLHGEASSKSIDHDEQMFKLLIEGMAKPMLRLESLCFWWLHVPHVDADHDLG